MGVSVSSDRTDPVTELHLECFPVRWKNWYFTGTTFGVYGSLRAIQLTDNKQQISVLFVCMGNICRSPSAEGVLRKVVADAGLADAVDIDSAGTHAYHVGHAPDRRAAEAAERRGYSLDNMQARRIESADYERFDYILAMDELNLHIIRENAIDEHSAELRLFMDFAEENDEIEVPDPYYGAAAGFERVLDLLEEASQGLLETLQTRLR